MCCVYIRNVQHHIDTAILKELGKRFLAFCIREQLMLDKPALLRRECRAGLDPNCFLVDTSRLRVNRLLHFCGILFVLTVYALNGFFLLIRCISFWIIHYIYIEGSQLKISKLNYIFLSEDPFFIHVANNVVPDEMRHSSRSSLFARRYTFMPNQYKWFINYFSICLLI